MKSNWFLLSVTLLSLTFFAFVNKEKSVAEMLGLSPLPTDETALTHAPETLMLLAPPTSTGAKPRTAQEMVAAGYKRYGVEKGSLVFSYDGVSSGTDHIYFDNWGWREAKYSRTKTELGTFKDETNAVQYLDGENRYVYNPATKKAKYYDSRQAVVVADQHGTKDMVAFGDVLLRNMGGKQSGKAMVSNIECDVWVIEKNNVKLFMWKGLTMGEESYVNGYLVGRHCVNMDFKKNPPVDKLVLPKEAVVVGKN